MIESQRDTGKSNNPTIASTRGDTCFGVPYGTSFSSIIAPITARNRPA